MEHGKGGSFLFTAPSPSFVMVNYDVIRKLPHNYKAKLVFIYSYGTCPDLCSEKRCSARNILVVALMLLRHSARGYWSL
jgi:hypothetical protein